MLEEIISRSIFTKVRDQAGIELPTPGSAVRCVTHCANKLGISSYVGPYCSQRLLCCLLITFANNLDPHQEQNIGPERNLNPLTL